jgi:hypothetical protein
MSPSQRCGRVGLGGVEDLDRGGGIEGDDLASTRQRRGQAWLEERIGQEVVVRRVVVGDAGVRQRADPETGQDLDEAGHVVLVRMAEHHHVDAPREERQAPAEPPQGQLGIRPAIDQHRGAAGRLDQDRVALPDVEHGHVQSTVGPGGDGDRQQDQHHCADDRQRPKQPTQ